jgi:two-component sensor histidine kinase
VDTVLHEASVTAAQGLNSRLAKVLRYRPDSQDFLVAAGVGWRPGVVGQATLPAGPDSPAGYALLSGEPVLANSLGEEKRFRMPALLAEHSVQSAINVVIGPVEDDVFGVLEVDSTHRHDFVAADTSFLQAMANVLAVALARANAERAKDELLREKDLLMQEVHHRVKNSLQLVQTMLHLQARSAGPEVRGHLGAAASRVMTIGAVHHRLYSGRSVEQTNAAEFLNALLADIRAMVPDQEFARQIDVRVPPISVSADATTALGLVVTELVTNAAKYGAGRITVEVAQTPQGLRVTVEDGGPGFPADFDPASSKGLGMRLIGALANTAPNSIAIDRSVTHGRISVLLRP